MHKDSDVQSIRRTTIVQAECSSGFQAYTDSEVQVQRFTDVHGVLSTSILSYDDFGVRALSRAWYMAYKSGVYNFSIT